MSGTHWQQPDHQPQPRGWSPVTKIAVAVACASVVGLGLGAWAASLTDDSDDDSEQIAETAGTSTTTTSEPTPTTASTTTAPPAPVVIPPEGYSQDQADAFSADLTAAVSELPAEMHQSFLEIGAIECGMVDLDPEIGPTAVEASRANAEGTISDALQANGVEAASAVGMEERVRSAAADAAADHLCPEHAEHIRIDG